MNRPAADKIVSAGRAAEIVAAWRGAGLHVAVAQGRFDLLEIGHVHRLMECRRAADRLAVEVLDDAGSGAGRGTPALGEAERARLVAALRIVDLVAIVPRAGTGAALVEPDAGPTMLDRVRERHGGR